MKKLLIINFALFLFGCSKAPNEVWTAEKDTPAYLAENDALDRPAFIIRTGEACKIGETSYGKVDAYIEVNCKSGKGWITASENFNRKIIKSESD